MIEDKGRNSFVKKLSTSMTKPRLDRAKGLKRGDVVLTPVHGDSSPNTGDRLSSSPAATSVHDKGRRPTKEDWKKQTSFRVRGKDSVKEMEELYKFLGLQSNDGFGIPADEWQAHKSLNSRPVSPMNSQPVSPICAYAPGSSAYSSSEGDDFRFDLQPTSLDLSSNFGSPVLSPGMSPGRLVNDGGKEHDKQMSPGKLFNNAGKEHDKRLSSPPQLSPLPQDIPQKVVHLPQKTTELFSPSSGSSFRQLKEAFHATLHCQARSSRSGSEESLSSAAWIPEGVLGHRHSEPAMKWELLSPDSGGVKFFDGASESGKDAKAEVKAQVPAEDGGGGRAVKDSLPRAVTLPPLLIESSHTGVGDVSVQESAKSPCQRSILWHGRSPPRVEHMNRKPVSTLSNALRNAHQPLMETFQVASPVDDTAEVVSGEISKVDSEVANVVPKALQVPRKKVSLPSKWRKGELLGSGSFGTVYEGVGNNGCFFAVKEVSLLDEGKQAKQSILQLQQEIALLSELEHENIVQYLGTESTGDKLYIFLELVSKGSLASVYKKYPMVEEQVCAYTQQILHGLKYLHDRNIIHRDIKCANLLVDVSGVVKLADFGMAKEIDKLDKLKSCKGSAYWMAPEVIDATKTYGIAADIWSLGCTVLEMVTGKPPLSDLEWQAVLWRVGHGEAPPIPENMSADLKDFIKQCLEVDVNKRPTVDMLLTHPLVCSEPTLGSFRLVATTELSTIAEEKSFHSSNTGTTDATDREAKNHTQGGVSRVVRGRLGHSLRTIRSELSMSSNSFGIPS